MMRKKLMDFVLLIVTIYLVSLVGLYFFQRQMIYFPNRSEAFGPSDPVLEVKTSDDLTLKSLFIAPRDKTKPLLVMFHGNAGHAGHRLTKMGPFVQAGYGVLVSGYRGYGGNPGKPAENNFYADADRLMITLTEKGYSADKIVLYGESLGTGVASYVAANHSVKGLIFDAPFISLAQAAAEHYPIFPVKTLIKDRYDTIARINNIKAPILFLHGTEDRVIPFHHSEKLYDVFNGQKEFHVIEGGNHYTEFTVNPAAQEAVLTFLKGLK